MNESNLFGISIRGLLVVILTVTVCILTTYIVMSLKPDLKIPEPLYSAFMLALGFYFGQKTQGGNNVQSDSKSSS